MNKDQGNQSVPIVYNKSSISLPLDEDAFREFMVSLLGQPESIEGYIEGAFEIDIGGFDYLNNLIDDRIAKQNQSSLLEFRAKLFFNDGSSISFNGIQNFLSYRELRPLICAGFVFTWSYLVKFNDRQVSERQEITISSIADDSPSKSTTKNKSILADFEFDLSDEMPRIHYSVRCTEKGWGIEITELTRRCLTGFIKTKPSSGIYLRRRIIENFKLVNLSCLVISFFGLMMFASQSLEVGVKECRSLSSQSEQFTRQGISLDEKIIFLVQLVSACNLRHSSSFLSLFLPMFLFFIVSLLLPFLIYKLIKLPDYRFLLFTEASRKDRDEYFRKTNDRKTFWIVTILIGLIIGVLGNYIFTWLTTILR